TVVGNRNHIETEPLIGCFMNFLPLRSRVAPEESAARLLERLKATVLESYAHFDYPFEKVVEAVNPNRKVNENPLYNVAFLMQNFLRYSFRGDDLQAKYAAIERLGSVLDLRFV